MKESLQKVWRVIRTILGVDFALVAFGGIVTSIQKPALENIAATVFCAVVAILLLWRKKKKKKQNVERKECLAALPLYVKKEMPYISYNTATARKYELTEDEMAFLDALEEKLRAAKKSTYCRITRMANGALSVNSSRAYLGKIKLQGRKTWMQYMVRNDAESVEDAPLEEYIRHLNFWVRSA